MEFPFAAAVTLPVCAAVAQIASRMASRGAAIVAKQETCQVLETRQVCRCATAG